MPCVVVVSGKQTRSDQCVWLPAVGPWPVGKSLYGLIKTHAGAASGHAREPTAQRPGTICVRARGRVESGGGASPWPVGRPETARSPAGGCGLPAKPGGAAPAAVGGTSPPAPATAASGGFLFFYFLFLFFTKIYFRFGNLQKYTPAAPLPGGRDLAARQRGGMGICEKNFREKIARRSLGAGRPAAGRTVLAARLRGDRP